jgi:hypothetical protein
MGENVILFPYCIDYDNRHSFAFAVEMARKTNARIITLPTYNLTYKYLLTAEAYRKVADNEKNKIYVHLLQLRGYYQGKFNKWESLDKIKFKNIINEGNLEFILLHLLKNETLIIMILNYYSYPDFLTLNEFTIMMLNKYNLKCIVLPEDTEFYTADPNLPPHLFKKHKEHIFKQMLARAGIINLPEDSALLKNELAAIN